jgi:hypothetical protein
LITTLVVSVVVSFILKRIPGNLILSSTHYA